MEPARGFIALMSAVVISVILLGVAATLDEGVFFARSDGLGFERERIAERLADSCLEMGMEKLADDYDYLVLHDPAYDATEGGVPVPLGTLYEEPTSCVITAPTTTPPEIGHTRAYTVTAYASFQGSWSTKTATVIVTNPRYATGTSDPYIASGRWVAIP